MSDAPLPPLPGCPLCGSKPTFGILGARGQSVWCIGPCPLSYGTFTPEQWRRLAAPAPVHDTVLPPLPGCPLCPLPPAIYEERPNEWIVSCRALSHTLVVRAYTRREAEAAWIDLCSAPVHDTVREVLDDAVALFHHAKNGGPAGVAPFRVPDETIVARLEDALAQARAGKILGVVMVTSEGDGETGSLIAVGEHAGVMALLGELEATKVRFMNEFVEGVR